MIFLNSSKKNIVLYLLVSFSKKIRYDNTFLKTEVQKDIKQQFSHRKLKSSDITYLRKFYFSIYLHARYNKIWIIDF